MTMIGFIGLGVMGAPMAVNLQRAGFEATGYSRTPHKADSLIAAGGRRAASIAEAVKNADIVITMLPDSPDVEEVIAGDDGVLAHAGTGTVVIDMSTISPKTARSLAVLGPSHGILVLDAPVSGGEQAAIEATLSIMAGGDETAFATVRPVFDVLGSTVVYVGPAGSGQTVKAANQLIVAGVIELVSEALVFLDAHDVEPKRAVDVIAGGLAGNAILDRKAATMLARDFAPGFRIELHHKDLGIVTAAAREAGVAIPLGAHVASLVASLQARGYGALDHTALLLQVEQMSGRSSGASTQLPRSANPV